MVWYGMVWYGMVWYVMVCKVRYGIMKALKHDLDESKRQRPALSKQFASNKRSEKLRIERI